MQRRSRSRPRRSSSGDLRCVAWLLIAFVFFVLSGNAPGVAYASCGDGMLDTGEDCEDGNVTNGDCCSSACNFEERNPCLSQGFSSSVVFSGPPLSGLSGLAFKRQNELFVSDKGNPVQTGKQTLVRLDLSTSPPTVSTLLHGLPLGGPDRILVGEGNAPAGNDLILADQDSEETATCCQGRVFRIDTDLCTGPEGACPPAAIAVLAKGNPAFPPLRL